MNGITILNTIDSHLNIGLIIGLAVVLLAVLTLFVLIILSWIKDGYEPSIIAGFITGIVVVILCISLLVYNYKIDTQYQVTIDDTVSFNKFNEKYKIISQSGQVYTIEER